MNQVIYIILLFNLVATGDSKMESFLNKYIDKKETVLLSVNSNQSINDKIVGITKLLGKKKKHWSLSTTFYPNSCRLFVIEKVKGSYFAEYRIKVEEDKISIENVQKKELEIVDSLAELKEFQNEFKQNIKVKSQLKVLGFIIHTYFTSSLKGNHKFSLESLLQTVGVKDDGRFVVLMNPKKSFLSYINSQSPILMENPENAAGNEINALLGDGAVIELSKKEAKKLLLN